MQISCSPLCLRRHKSTLPLASSSAAPVRSAGRRPECPLAEQECPRCGPDHRIVARTASGRHPDARLRPRLPSLQPGTRTSSPESLPPIRRRQTPEPDGTNRPIIYTALTLDCAREDSHFIATPHISETECPMSTIGPRPQVASTTVSSRGMLILALTAAAVGCRAKAKTDTAGAPAGPTPSGPQAGTGTAHSVPAWRRCWSRDGGHPSVSRDGGHGPRRDVQRDLEPQLGPAVA